MKQWLMVAFAASAIISAVAFKPLNSQAPDCKYGQCSFFKKNGEQCHNCAQEGSAYCWSHNHQ